VEGVVVAFEQEETRGKSTTMQIGHCDFFSSEWKIVDQHDGTSRKLSLQLENLVEMLKSFGAHKSGNQLGISTLNTFNILG
jgi:hypothetical protein